MPISCCCSLTRKTLSEQSWPEGDAKQGRAALRITLRHLRHLLFEGADVSLVPLCWLLRKSVPGKEC